MSGYAIYRAVIHIKCMSSLVKFGVAIKDKSHLLKWGNRLYVCEGVKDEATSICLGELVNIPINLLI